MLKLWEDFKFGLGLGMGLIFAYGLLRLLLWVIATVTSGAGHQIHGVP